MEEEYLTVVAKGYGGGKEGRRGIDSLVQAFAKLIELMEETRKDVLGDLFQGGITYGEAGQFLTPEQLCKLMAELCIDRQQKDEFVADPCCGSGRMLLAYAEGKRPGALIGQDIDLRCVRMTTINLALRNLYGYVLWGNSLGNEVKLGYRTGMNMFGGFVRYMRRTELHDALASRGDGDAGSPTPATTLPSGRQQVPGKQLELF